MALSGNLGFVPLDEVLRLLMRSDQRGSVDVRGEDIRGRVFVGKKGISLATTAEDRDLHKHLANSGYVDDGFLRKVAAGDSTFSDLGDRESQVIELLREMTVESLYHLDRKGTTFEVTEGATSPYSSPAPFELEAVLDDSRRRADEWATVQQVIGDLESTIRMNRSPGNQEEIRINREAWRLLCELGAGASVRLMAERLGTTEFWIAKVASEMAEQELLVLSDDRDFSDAPAEPARAYERDPNESWWTEPEDDGPEPEAIEPPSAEEEGEPEPASRFGHYVKAASPETTYTPQADTVEPSVQEVEPADDRDYLAAPVFESESDVVEEDTEAFLEKVFSQLEVNGQADIEEEGHGLLRRRRMGSVLKEIDEG